MDKISFSIVVASKGRVALLADLMKSIQAAREHYGGKCEVLIVDDSEPEECRQIQDACRDYGCLYRYYKEAVSAKRNYGAQQAKHEVILFLDSDCIATEHILERYAEKYNDSKVAAVAGPLEFVGPDTWFWKAIGSRDCMAMEAPPKASRKNATISPVIGSLLWANSGWRFRIWYSIEPQRLERSFTAFQQFQVSLEW